MGFKVWGLECRVKDLGFRGRRDMYSLGVQTPISVKDWRINWE